MSGMRPLSTRSPSIDSSAGSTVSEPGTAMPTPVMAPIAIPLNTEYPVRNTATSADFRTATSALGSGEFEVELASVPPGDGGVGGEAGLAEDG